MHHRVRSGHPSQARFLPFAALLLGATPAAQVTGPAAVGDPVADVEFAPLANHDGRTRLSELVGQPVILAGWRRHLAEGLDAAYLAHDLHLAFGDDGLLVVLQDREPWEGDPKWVVDVDFWYRFFGTPLWITESVDATRNEVDIAREASAVDDRSLVLIGIDGHLLLETTVIVEPQQERKKLKKTLEGLIKQELKRRKSGWGDDALARKARGLVYGKGDFSGALELLDGAKETQCTAEHDVVRAEAEACFAARVKTVEFLLDQGRAREGKDALASLAKGTRGHAAFEATLAPLVERLDTDAGRAALKDDKALARILDVYTERDLGKLDLDLIRELRAFAAGRPDSPAVERARRLDPLLKRIVRILRKIPEKDFEARVSDD